MNEELKEYLSECLDCIEGALESLDLAKDHDFQLKNWYDDLNEIYEKIRLKYE